MSSTIDEWRKRFSSNAKDKPIAGNTTHELVVNAGLSKEVYQAFNAQDKVVRLDIRCASTSMGHSFPCQAIHEITYENRNYNCILLTVSGISTKITGRNLRPIVEALKLNKCEFIQEYHHDLFMKPTDDGAPFIDRIDVKVIKAAPKG